MCIHSGLSGSLRHSSQRTISTGLWLQVRIIPFGPTTKNPDAAEHPVETCKWWYFDASITHSGISVPKCPLRSAFASTASAVSATFTTSSAVKSSSGCLSPRPPGRKRFRSRFADAPDPSAPAARYG